MEQPRRILYIDDDAGLRRLVEKLLGRRGHTVISAASGQEGIDLLKADTGFELIAVDHYMPGMDGLATLSALRKIRSCPPVVYVTGSEESSVAVAALKAGAHDYVVKTLGGEFVDLLEKAFANALSAIRLKNERDAAEDALRLSNERLQTLLKEVNHRVANSLQLVSAMVSMQSRHLGDDAARKALADTQRRIQAIAQVHRSLYTSDEVESVAVDEYLAAIVAELEDTWSSPAARRDIRLTADPVKLETDKAVSLGMIVNELISNACKYAYGDDQSGEIRVTFARRNANQFELTVEDDGCGLVPGAEAQGTGLGSRILTAMASSLSSKLTYDDAHKGCRAVLVANL